MLRYYVLMLFVFLCCQGQESFGMHTLPDYNKLSDSLKTTVANKQNYIDIKNRHIDSLKSTLSETRLSQEDQIVRRINISDEYAKFNVDSAILYAVQANILAHESNHSDLVTSTLLRECRLLSTCGRFREAENIIKTITPGPLPDSLKLRYYDTYNAFWEYYSISVPHAEQPPTYYKDSLMHYLPRTSYHYKVTNAAALANTDSTACRIAFETLLEEFPDGSPQYAMLTNYYGSINRDWGNIEEAKRLYAISAINDIQSSTRETLSLQFLAQLLYNEGNVSDAYIYSQSTIDDIFASGISLRAAEIYNLFSIVTEAYNIQEQSRKKNLSIFITLLAIALLLAGVSAIYSFRQMRRIMRIKQELAETNTKLATLIQELNDKNNQLLEANNIKEEYITQFFDLCFCYISKMEKTQNYLYKLFCSKSFEELGQHLKPESTISEELRELYSRFDTVFLTIYPTFVEDVNSLLREDEKLYLRQSGCLNRELRIYALMRLGISDSSKIAEFLRCSVSTVYNYRTKMRNKAFDRDGFESSILDIKPIHAI